MSWLLQSLFEHWFHFYRFLLNFFNDHLSKNPLQPLNTNRKKPITKKNTKTIQVYSDDECKEETTIEKTYQKLTQLEHVLLRPDTYSNLFFSLSLSTLICNWISLILCKLGLWKQSHKKCGYTKETRIEWSISKSLL